MLDIHFPFLHHHEAQPAPKPEPEHTEVATMSTAPVAHETVGQKIVDVEKKFISILDWVGQEAEKGLVFAVKYAMPVAGFVSLIFPGIAPEANGAVVALNLIQNAVLEVKAKSAALPTNLTPAQMLADELQLVGPAVIALLQQEKVTVDAAQVQKYIQAVVAILDTQAVAA